MSFHTIKKQYPEQRNRSQWLFQSVALSLFSILISTLLWVTPAQATGVYDMPNLISQGKMTWVVDQANVLSRLTEGNLKNTFEDLAETTGTEIRMVALRRLDYGETMDGFTNKLFTKWFPQETDQTNQVLLALDTLTNNVSLRKGEGVSELLTNEIATSVLKETMSKPLQETLYNQALLDASNRLVAVLSGQPDPGPPVVEVINVEGTFATAEETDDTNATIWVVVLLVLATVIPMVTYFWYVGF